MLPSWIAQTNPLYTITTLLDNAAVHDYLYLHSFYVFFWTYVSIFSCLLICQSATIIQALICHTLYYLHSFISILFRLLLKLNFAFRLTAKFLLDICSPKLFFVDCLQSIIDYYKMYILYHFGSRDFLISICIKTVNLVRRGMFTCSVYLNCRKYLEIGPS